MRTDQFYNDWEVVSWFVFTLERFGLSVSTELELCWDEAEQDAHIESRIRGAKNDRA